MESTDLKWRKASYSSNGGSDCVELADNDGLVLVRDTKQAGTGPVLNFSADAWQAFTGSLKTS
jgi:hypothetical protein